MAMRHHSGKKSKHRTKDGKDTATPRLRRDLAVTVMILVAVISVVATFQSGAMPVLDKMLPLLALVFGFFFGQKTGGT